MRWRLASLFLVCALPVSVAAQSQARPMITQAIDETKLVKLSGNVHPLAQAKYDQGAVPDTFPAARTLLLLNRPPEREAALQQFLNDVHRRGSASYHQWLTPQEFGSEFGPADSDIQTIKNWLSSQGFSVAKVSQSKQFIEFSGTAGQLRTAFHTEIHQYNVEGATHYANASDISIPAALAPVVRGISPLNNFWAQPYYKVVGEALYSRSTKKTTPLLTIPNPFGTSNPYAYPVAPEDFATEYDLSPLYAAGVNGGGQTIGIINASNIDLSLVNDYRQLFNLSNNTPQVVIDGNDPGDVIGDDTEAYLDVEVSGAVAPNATIDLYISNGSDLDDPVALAGVRAVEDNQASVLSVSFGNCEQYLGVDGNLFWNALWEQAAAQGQTVFVATGDTGPECNLFLGVSVSGLSSTPWNVGVGGTDFYYSDYATGGASATTLWNQTNDASLGSLIAPLPEQVWNDPFGLDVISDGLARGEIYGGGGGASSCITLTGTSACFSGYAKPSWQTGPGVPPDGARDLPDVSLFASNGANLSAYPICAGEGECAPGSGDQALIYLVGGTSGSTPAMAGIMALVDQKYGRQGQANFTLYPLAQQKPASFHDITLGSNFSVCFQGSADCFVNASGDDETSVYPATQNYDLASGLGSVDASALVNNWNSITFLPTATTLKLSSTKIKHGTPITVTTSVAPSSGSGTPTGSVAILTSSPLPSSQSQAYIPLSSASGSASINYFPGGYYNVSAYYQGDAIYGSSTSSPVALTVIPENSNISLLLLSGGNEVPIGGTIQYNAPLELDIEPIGDSAPPGQSNGNATGTVKFTIDSTTATVPLNSVGVAAWMPPALGIGTHTASATYSGDASFNSSTASAVTFNVTKGVPWINDNINGYISSSGPVYNVQPGGSLTITIQVGPTQGPEFGVSAPLGTAAPTGTVTACLEPTPNLQVACTNPSYSQTATLTAPSGTKAEYSTATVTLTNLAAGSYYPFYSYSGDANWQMEGLQDVVRINVAAAPALAASSTVLGISPASISTTGLATITTTITGTGTSNTTPTGLIYFYNNGIFFTYAALPAAKTGTMSSVSFQASSSSFWNNGANQVTAIYQGDTNYLPSTSNVANITVAQGGGDFSLTPLSPQIAVQSGGSGTVSLSLTSLNNFNGSVNLTCMPSSSAISCGVSPSTVPLNGTASATLMINSSAQAAQRSSLPGSRIVWPGVAGGCLIALLLLGAFPNRKRRLAMALNFGLFSALLLFADCGGGGGQTGQQQPPPPPQNGVAYTVLVNATANGTIHNAKITVIVP